MSAPSRSSSPARTVPAVEQGDLLTYLEPREKQFDLICAMDIIEHLHKGEAIQLLDACFGALKPGGRLIVQTPNSDAPLPGILRYGDFTHEICLSPNSITWILQACGFSSIACREMEPVPRGYSLNSSVRWCGWQLIRMRCMLYNLLETGHPGSKVFTRVFVTSALKPWARVTARLDRLPL